MCVGAGEPKKGPEMGVGEQIKGAFEAIAPESKVPDVTLVVPGLNEAESLPLLAAQVREALAPDTTYELIFVDDGSTDDSWQVISDLNYADPAARGIRLRKNFGQTSSLNGTFGSSLKMRSSDRPIGQ